MARMSVAERREQLIDAAIVVMSRDGVANTTTRAIVAEAGMQVGVFHYCFRSKEELVLEVMRRINERSFQAVGEVLNHSTDAAELIRMACDAYWRHIEANPLEHLITYELTQYALRQDGQSGAAEAQYENYTTGMAAFLTAVAEVGRITWRSPIEVLSRIVLAIVEGVTLQWIVTRDAEMTRRTLDQLAVHLLHDAGLDSGHDSGAGRQ